MPTASNFLEADGADAGTAERLSTKHAAAPIVKQRSVRQLIWQRSLDYALKHIRNNKNKIDLQFLVDTFHQPFIDLPTDCEAVEKQLRQVRICIEVLRSYLGNRPLADPVKEAALAKAEGDYRFAAYAMLLNRIGTSYEEIRRIRAETPENRKALAERLGIDLTEPRPER